MIYRVIPNINVNKIDEKIVVVPNFKKKEDSDQQVILQYTFMYNSVDWNIF